MWAGALNRLQRQPSRIPGRITSPMAIFLTGSTGYLGSYLATGLFRGYRDPLNLLVRAKNRQGTADALLQSLQLHMDFPEFNDRIGTCVRIFLGDLTNQQFGLPD